MPKTHTKPGRKAGEAKVKRLVSLSPEINKKLEKAATKQGIEPASLIAKHVEDIYG